MLALLPRLLLAVTVAELALAGPFGDLDLLPFGMRAAQAARPRPRIEDVEDSLAHDRSFKVRVDAALILGRLRQPRSVPALIGALRDPFAAVRASAAVALGRIGSPIARDAVYRASQDPSPVVRKVAREALRQIAGPDGVGADGGGAASGATPASASPSIRPRTIRRRSFEVKTMGDLSRRATPVLRSHMRDFLVDQLRPIGEVAQVGRAGDFADFAIDGVIKDLKVTTSEADVEVTCQVQLTISKQPSGGVFLLTSGEATVQKPRRQFRPQQTPGMQLEALEGAVRAASEDLVRNLGQQ